MRRFLLYRAPGTSGTREKNNHTALDVNAVLVSAADEADARVRADAEPPVPNVRTFPSWASMVVGFADGDEPTLWLKCPSLSPVVGQRAPELSLHDRDAIETPAGMRARISQAESQPDDGDPLLRNPLGYATQGPHADHRPATPKPEAKP